MKYIKLFESTDASEKIRLLSSLNLLTSEDTYSSMIAKKSPYFSDRGVEVHYGSQTIKVETQFDETLGNVCDMYNIPVNSYTLSQAERSLYTTITISYDFESSQITYSVRVYQKDISLNETDRNIESMESRGLTWDMLEFDKTASFIAEDLNDYLGEATDKASEMLKKFLREEGHSDFV